MTEDQIFCVFVCVCFKYSTTSKSSTDYSKSDTLGACLLLFVALTSHRPSCHHHLCSTCFWSPLSLVLSSCSNRSKDACAQAIDTKHQAIYNTVTVKSIVINHIMSEWYVFAIYLNCFVVQMQLASIHLYLQLEAITPSPI